jgi:hypothetical protein
VSDPPKTIEIAGSPPKMVALVFGGVIMTAGSALLAFRILPIAVGSLEEFIGYVGLIFFGLCTLLLLWRALTMRGPVVTMDVHGIRDVRVAKETIPWGAIRDISTWQYQRQKVMVLAVDPETERNLHLSRIARWSRGANKRLGADGLCVTAQGLKISYDELLSTVMAYWKAAS